MRLGAEALAAIAAIVPRIRQWADAWGVPAVGLWCILAGNAWAESRFDPRAAGDSGWSIGLWQCNRRAGLGRPYTVAQLQDPVFNLDVVMNEARRLGLYQLIHGGASIADATAWFTRNVERPDHTDEKARERAGYADGFARQLGHTGATRVLDAV